MTRAALIGMGLLVALPGAAFADGPDPEVRRLQSVVCDRNGDTIDFDVKVKNTGNTGRFDIFVNITSAKKGDSTFRNKEKKFLDRDLRLAKNETSEYSESFDVNKRAHRVRINVVIAEVGDSDNDDQEDKTVKCKNVI